jgi:endogenous inhibitor of DNA gyrase (YacG/DUF329 family)
MNSYRTRTWKGFNLQCPQCTGDVKYWRSRNDIRPTPFFYCNRCNNILERTSDRMLMPRELLGLHGHNPQLSQLFERILSSAPKCDYGGSFTLWANVKCPLCWYEFPWTKTNDKDPLDVRIHASHVVVIDGALTIGDGPEDCWLERVETDS